MRPTDTDSKSTSHRHKKALYKSGEKNLHQKSWLKFGCLVTVKERDSEVAVVHRSLQREVILS